MCSTNQQWVSNYFPELSIFKSCFNVSLYFIFLNIFLMEINKKKLHINHFHFLITIGFIINAFVYFHYFYVIASSYFLLIIKTKFPEKFVEIMKIFILIKHFIIDWDSKFLQKEFTIIFRFKLKAHFFNYLNFLLYNSKIWKNIFHRKFKLYSLLLK